MIRLRKLDLSLFGHFTDQSIDFGDQQTGGSDFHIVYGPNEAGKTTMMEGYLRLLYGFPSKDAYAFKHQRANLRVGGTIEINGAAHNLTRLSTRNANLVNVTGNVVPESFFQSALGGLSMEDYRKLLCLDDETIVAGGEEITKSKGDIGRLLFSAAAGVSDLSEVLDKVEEQTLEIYRKGGSKSLFAALKREHEKVNHEIKTHDVSASAYRVLRDARDQTETREATLREGKKELSLANVRLNAIIKAHPLALILKEAEMALEPIGHYPEDLDIDPETLVKILSERAGLNTARDRATKDLTELEQQRQSLVSKPETVKLVQPLNTLKALKNRVETAQFDLPKRKAQVADEMKELSRRLSDLGIEKSDADPTQFILGAPQLAALENNRSLLRDAEQELARAKAEEHAASEKLKGANDIQKAAHGAVTVGPELGELVARYDADALLGRFTAACQERALSKRQLSLMLQSLTRLGKTFDQLPDVVVTAAQATVLASQAMKADQTLTSSKELMKVAAQKSDKAKTALEVSSSVPNLINDTLAAETRRYRDELWAVHRGALDTQTADQFETSMQADDTNRAIRQEQGNELAEHRHAIRAEIEARHDFEAAKEAHDVAQIAVNGLREKLNGFLDGSGLAESLLADEFATWVRQAEEAHQAKSACTALEDEHAQIFQMATDLRDALAKELSQPGATLEALVGIARVQIAQRAKEQQKIQNTDADVVRETAETERRNAKRSESDEKLSASRQSWETYVARYLPDVGPEVDLLEALPTLRALREISERMTGVRRQIDGMEQDLNLFENEIRKLDTGAAASSDVRPLDIFAELDAQASEAFQVEQVLADLKETIGTKEKELEASKAALEKLDAQVRELSLGFDSRIQTATLEDLREAVKTSDRAISLRTTAKKTLRELLSTLHVSTKGQAEAELDSLNAVQAAADLQDNDAEIVRIEQSLDKAIEDRTRAKLELDAVIGDSYIASLVAHRRTIEAEMVSVMLSYLEQRFGHMLADRAIRLYRDTHRNEMMTATEKAFSDLTNGAYSSLTTQLGAGSEMLMAIQASDQVVKEASTMSKGTRFQLYLALRAAAYEQMASNGTILPFFCDDVFETFDDGRTRAACGLMHRIGQTGQAIYLTHHQHVVDIAKEACGEQVKIHTL